MDRCAPRRAASRSRRSPVVCSTFSASHGAPADCTGLAAGRATGHPQTPQRAAQRRTGARAGQRAPTGTPYLATHMAKDTEKLIRQLSLISYLMAERRPVTALEIRRDVEGYSGMNEDAFARRFYADRSELESLGIHLTVDRPVDGVAEQENYSLRPENFHLPPIAFTDEELASLQFALTLLDGEFAYAEPLRLALQQISWGRPSPLRAPDQRSVALGITGVGRRPRALPAPGEDRDGDLPPQDDHLRLLHDGARRDRRAQGRPLPPAVPGRAVLPARPLRTSATRCASSGCRASRARSPTRRRPSTTSSARPTSTRARTPTAPSGSSATRTASAEVWISERIAWQVERHFGRFGEIARGRRRRRRLRARRTPTRASSPRGSCASASTRASSDPPELVARGRRAHRAAGTSRHEREPDLAPVLTRRRRPRQRRRATHGAEPTAAGAARRRSAPSASRAS